MRINLYGMVFALIAFAIDVHLGKTNWALFDVFGAAANLFMYLNHDNSPEA